MTETKAEYKTENRGGARAGSGRPAVLKERQVVKLYLDKATLTALKRVHKNRSKAVRILAGTDHP